MSRCEDSPYTSDEVDFLMHTSQQVALAVENAMARNELQKLKDNAAGEMVYLENPVPSERKFPEVVGKSTALQQVLRQIEVVAPTGSGVLVQGETGTGKELVTRAIHQLSERASRPFVRVNCAAIPAALCESEFFGHERGAFTGAAARRAGRFELANKGTIFLDEVGELPLELQPKLLRVLQEGEYEPVGSSQTRKVDVRVLAATNRDLSADVRCSRKSFRPVGKLFHNSRIDEDKRICQA